MPTLVAGLFSASVCGCLSPHDLVASETILDCSVANCRFQVSDHAQRDKSCGKDCDRQGSSNQVEVIQRRKILFSSLKLMAGALFAVPAAAASSRSEFADMPALRGKDYGKTKMRYPDYTETDSGLQFKDLRVGTGPNPKVGDTVVVDWDGYTIGYYGRIFEARNKTKGGSFEGDDKDFFKFRIGSQEDWCISPTSSEEHVKYLVEVPL